MCQNSHQIAALGPQLQWGKPQCRQCSVMGASGPRVQDDGIRKKKQTLFSPTILLVLVEGHVPLVCPNPAVP